MSTSQFYRMKLTSIERTPILIIPAGASAFCFHCQTVVTPNKIVTAFLSRALLVCPRCSSVIQTPRKVVPA